MAEPAGDDVRTMPPHPGREEGSTIMPTPATRPGADERRARVLLLASMRRPGAWTRTVDGVDAVDTQVKALPCLPLLAGEGRGQ